MAGDLGRRASQPLTVRPAPAGRARSARARCAWRGSGPNWTATPFGAMRPVGMIRPGIDDNPIASGSANVQYSSRSVSVFQTAREPISPTVLTHTSTRAISWRRVPSARATLDMQNLRRRVRGATRAGSDESQRHAGDGGLHHDREHVVGAGAQRQHRGIAESRRGRPHGAVTAEQHHGRRATRRRSSGRTRWCRSRMPVDCGRVRNSISGSRTRADGGAARSR